MKIRLVNYLNSIRFFSSNQYGFRKGLSTEDALISVTNMIYSSINQGKKSSGLFIDFKKAFDMVDHEILLMKLAAAGVRGIALSWFRSFLTGREQQVRVGKVVSTPLSVTTGVPQGSVIAATLFLIFINDLLELNFNGNASAFADDIALFYSQKDVPLLKTLISEDLTTLKVWCSSNKMQVNVDKTKYVNFDFRDFTFNSDVRFHEHGCNEDFCDCKIITKEDNFKYLGVTFDSRLTWEKHITNLHALLKSTTRKFYFLQNFCDEKLLKTLYFALVNSRLEYGIICWGGLLNS